ncbi:MAG: radical SAM protein [bacterium]
MSREILGKNFVLTEYCLYDIFLVMKVFLINPPASEGVKIVREGRCMQRQGAWTSTWPPITLALCAGVLEMENIQVKLIDCIIKNIDSNSLKDQIAEFSPNLIILNTSTPSIESDLSIAKLAKDILPQVKVAALGIHVTVLPEECLSLFSSLDYCIRGEPEFIVKDLSLALRDGGSIKDISGLSYHTNGKIIHNPDREFISNLDELPFPAWHLIDTEDYRMPFKNVPFLLIATSRGCPYKCTFCADKAFYGTKLRLKSPKKVVDELEWVKKTFGVAEFLFWSESFTINNNFVLEVCEEILSRNLKVSWVCNSRVDNVDIALLRKIKEAGCWMIGYGVESGNQQVLNSVKKGTTLKQTQEAVRWAKEAGLEVTGHCILGLPGDTQETIKQTIDFTIELDLDFAQYYCAVPFPGAKLYTQALEQNWINTTDWTKFEQNFSVLDLPNIKANRIMELRREAFKKFYLRKKLLLKTLRRIKSLNQLITFIRMIKDFLTWI